MKKALLLGLAAGAFALGNVAPASAVAILTTSCSFNTDVVGSASCDLAGAWGGASVEGPASITITHIINDTAGDDFYFMNGNFFGASSSAFPNETAETFDLTAILAGSSVAVLTIQSSDLDGFFNDGVSWSASLTAAVPEPTTVALFGLGLLGLGFRLRKSA